MAGLFCFAWFQAQIAEAGRSALMEDGEPFLIIFNGA